MKNGTDENIQINSLNKHLCQQICKLDKKLLRHSEFRMNHKTTSLKSDQKKHMIKHFLELAIEELSEAVNRKREDNMNVKAKRKSELDVPNETKIKLSVSNCENRRSHSLVDYPNKRILFNLKLYNFYLPEKVYKEYRKIKCPPFILLLDHTIAVIWRMYLIKQNKRDQITPMHYNWALYFLNYYQNHIENKSVCINYCIKCMQGEICRATDFVIVNFKQYIEDFSKLTTSPKVKSIKCIKQASNEYGKLIYLQSHKKLQPIGRFILHTILKDLLIYSSVDNPLSNDEKSKVDMVLKQFQTKKKGTISDNIKNIETVIIPVDIKCKDIGKKACMEMGDGVTQEDGVKQKRKDSVKLRVRSRGSSIRCTLKDEINKLTNHPHKIDKKVHVLFEPKQSAQKVETKKLQTKSKKVIIDLQELGFKKIVQMEQTNRSQTISKNITNNNKIRRATKNINLKQFNSSKKSQKVSSITNPYDSHCDTTRLDNNSQLCKKLDAKSVCNKIRKDVKIDKNLIDSRKLERMIKTPSHDLYNILNNINQMNDFFNNVMQQIKNERERIIKKSMLQNTNKPSD